MTPLCGADTANSRHTPDSSVAASRSHDELRDQIRTRLPALRNFALSLTHNLSQADDLVQDTCLRAWRNAHHFEPGSNMQSWLFTILHNTFVSDLRSQRRRERLEAIDIDPVTHPAHDGRLALRDFMRAFDLLSRDQRDLIVLFGMFGHTYGEAANLLGISVGTAKSRVSRARCHLLARMDPGREVRHGDLCGTA
jgi:RNA polymerase sigma-70 factor (ECF subfamily)